MKRFAIVSIAALLSTSAAFADPAADGSGTMFEGASLRFGVAVAGTANVNISGNTFRGVADFDLRYGPIARPYVGFGLPIAVTDDWSVIANGDLSFTGADGWNVDSVLKNVGGVPVAARNFQTTDSAYWASLEFLAAYDLGDRVPFDGGAKVFGGLRWDHSYASVSNPQGLLFSPADFLHYGQDTLAPVIGMNATFKGSGRAILGGDIHVSAMGGPIVWGRSDYREEILAGVNQLYFKGDLNSGYFWKLAGDMEIISFGDVQANGMGGGISLFAQVSQTKASGSGMMGDYSTAGGFAAPRAFNVDTNGVVSAFGISANLKF